MSTRTYMVSIQSLDPIKQAIGSRDEALLDALLTAVGDDEDFQRYARGMIMESRPRKEPGCWNYLVEPLAEHFGLTPNRLPLEDWKHYYVWEDYRSLANPLISSSAQTLLQLLESGRPFHGSAIDHDGCMFAWLTPDEASLLLSELSAIDAQKFGDIDEFHEQLVESLQETVNKRHALFLGAH